MIGEITTKEELIIVRKENGRMLSELDNQLTGLKEEVDFLIEYPKNRITRIKQLVNINELKIPENVKVISIPEIKEGINSFLREYGLIKTDVNHSYSARSSFKLTPEEDEESRDQKRKSDQLQTEANKINNDLNEFKIWINGQPSCINDNSIEDGGMIQIDPPSLQLDAGPADTSIDSEVDDLEGIVVLC